MKLLGNDNEFVLQDDMKVISEWAGTATRISVRSAGKDTLKCLGRGAGAKPHSILEKTIKKKVLKDPKKQVKDKKLNDAVDAFFNDFPATKKALAEDLLMGLVGHWSKDGENYKVVGIYLTQLGANTFDRSKNAKVLHRPMQTFSLSENENKMPYLILNTKEDKKNLIDFFENLGEGMKKYYLFTRLFFSGDYDTHDLMRNGVPVVTGKDSEVLKGLQAALIAGRTEQIKKFEPTGAELTEEIERDYYRVQHGPQYNYIAQMSNENLAIVLNYIKNPDANDLKNLNVLVDSVMYMSLPVAACNVDGKWNILESIKDLKKFYADWGNKVKVTWMDVNTLEEHILHQINTVLNLKITHLIEKKKSDFKDFDGESQNANEGKTDERLSGIGTLLEAVPAYMAVYDEAPETLAEYVRRALCESLIGG